MTGLLYLQNFDVVECIASVEGVATAGDGRGRTILVLDQTCFYPRGGGQDWDKGTISSDGIQFIVEEVRLDDKGEVQHIGKFSSGRFMVGEDVDCVVDKQRRGINTRLHSAGHVVDMAVDALGLDWTPTKGQHYPELCAIEYSGTWSPEKSEELRLAIESKANELTAQESDNRIEFMPVEDMHKYCKNVPANIPTNKPGRIVIYGEYYGIPCGGTHVRNLSQIGPIVISKIKEKQGTIRVNYGVKGVNS